MIAPSQSPLVESDEALVSRVATGDRAAFASLVDGHQDAVFRFLQTLLSDEAAAEDAMQETFLAALRGAEGFRADGSLRSWLFTIARRLALRQRPRDVPTNDDSVLEELGRAAGFGETDPEMCLSREQERAVVLQALSKLTSEDREILVLRDMEGLTGPEAAEVLGIGMTAMKSRLHRARLRFAAAIRSEVTHG